MTKWEIAKKEYKKQEPILQTFVGRTIKEVILEAESLGWTCAFACKDDKDYVFGKYKTFKLLTTGNGLNHEYIEKAFKEKVLRVELDGRQCWYRKNNYQTLYIETTVE